MTQVTTTQQADGVVNMTNGRLTGAGAAVDVQLGFRPRFVRIFNETDVILWEKYVSQPDTDSMKQVAAGTTTKDTTSAIIIRGGAANNDSFRGFTLSAALAASGKVLHWTAEG